MTSYLVGMRKNDIGWSNRFFKTAVVSFSILVTGCTAVGVPATKDPAAKLRYADSMLDHGRPFPAEKLINEALDIYRKQDDEQGMAYAYRLYGLFFSSYAIVKRGYTHFRDPEATLDNRHFMAIKYFEKSADLFQRKEMFDALTNVYYLMSFEKLRVGDKESACKSLQSSEEANQQNLLKHPEEVVILPKGYSSYAQYIAGVRQKMGCN